VIAAAVVEVANIAAMAIDIPIYFIALYPIILPQYSFASPEPRVKD
jgi:hypothetical protein